MRHKVLPTRGKLDSPIWVEGEGQALAVAREAHAATVQLDAKGQVVSEIPMLVLCHPPGGIVREVALIPDAVRRSRRA